MPVLRAAEAELREMMAASPVLFLRGPRQSGKTTLIRGLARGLRSARYLTLDDATVRAAASRDPEGFLACDEKTLLLDEVQRVPDLLLAIKAEVDRGRRPGRFLLTGSSNVLSLPRVADSLAGRMMIHTLWPLAQAEIEGARGNFVDALFAAPPLPARSARAAEGRTRIFSRVARGGYPPPVVGAERAHAGAWYGSYLTSIVERDVREIAQVGDLSIFPRLLALLAARCGSIFNLSEVARALEAPVTTLQRHLALLETIFLVRRLPAWHANLGKRMVKSPRLLLTDTGLATHLLGLDRIPSDHALAGPLLENFVAMEIQKAVETSRGKPILHHFRTSSGREVDLVLEDRRGRIVGVEVKASVGLRSDDLRGLRFLAERTGARFHRGVVLYTGREAVSFGPQLEALPIPALWS